MADNPFAVNIFEQTVEQKIYDHGYPADKVDEIKQLHIALEKRVNGGGELASLEEFTTIVIPWCRINRTEEFIIVPEKEKKVKVPKEPKIKVAREAKVKAPVAGKEKKLTKKQVAEEIQRIVMAIAMGTATEDDMKFFNEQSTGAIL